MRRHEELMLRQKRQAIGDRAPDSKEPGLFSVADVTRLLHVPRYLGVPADFITQPELTGLVKNLARHLRDHNSVGVQLLASLRSYVAAEWAEMQCDTQGDGVVTRLWCAVVPPSSLEALYVHAYLGDNVQVIDGSHHLIGTCNDLLLYASLAPVREAGGATMPIFFLVHKSGNGVEGDLSSALTFARKFLHKKRLRLHDERGVAHAAHATAPGGPPPPPQPVFAPLELPTVTLFDKCKSSFQHAFESHVELAGCAAALECYTRVRDDLKLCMAGSVSPEVIAAAERVVFSVPGVGPDGVPRLPSVVPPTLAELETLFPAAFPLPCAPVSEATSRLFSPSVLELYGPLAPGLAAVILREMDNNMEALKNAGHSGQLNVISARFQSLLHFFARDSAAADCLSRYFIHVNFLCNFHTWQAIGRKAAALQQNLKGVFMEDLRKVLELGASWPDFKAKHAEEMGKTKVALDSSEVDKIGVGKGEEGTRMNFFEYIEKFWLCERWHSTVDERFRALFEKGGINTTNDVELFWCVRPPNLCNALSYLSNQTRRVPSHITPSTPLPTHPTPRTFAGTR